MEWAALLLLPLALCALLYLLGRWLLGLDGDLTLLWAEWRGKRPENELPDKVVWVTGASSGIGEELAYQLAKIGALIVLSARRENELERVKEKCLEISSLSSKDILVLPLDLTDRNSHEAATKTVLQHFGRGFFNSLRPELGEYPEIIITTICPGPVQSKIIHNVFTEELSKSLENTGDQSHKMPTDRCVRLTLVSIVNDLKEAWISDHPYLAICYLWQYAPTWAWWLLNKMGKIRIKNFKSGVDADVSYSKKKKA
ncbi:dehydrogenase/reductase SDR family member 7 isoform X2 [Chelonoidis abingdonii]|uniref:dehydrogenase/reductase SDR family member 7 isoform X2 n=1 Tax=Chelonoidis abingdonii TaxID=106734 RepID=UPI0013F2916A|nr:dehydrogenase/reductase SDR family member 7 isoform X2 [Chelonoidis abingdonii]